MIRRGLERTQIAVKLFEKESPEEWQKAFWLPAELDSWVRTW